MAIGAWGSAACRTTLGANRYRFETETETRWKMRQEYKGTKGGSTTRREVMFQVKVKSRLLVSGSAPPLPTDDSRHR